MEPDQPSSSDYDSPIAYDAEGQPLYAHPPLAETPIKTPIGDDNENQSKSPKQPFISDVVKLKHAQSRQSFPEIDLVDNEYIVTVAQRHAIGLFLPFVASLFLIVVAFVVLFNYDIVIRNFQLTNMSLNFYTIFYPMISIISCVILTDYVIYYVYNQNKLYLTNENIIQEIQTGPFWKREQIVNLINIEDVSYSQNGIAQQVFDYGSLRLTTEGSGTVYRFTYVINPREFITTLNSTLEDFRNTHSNS
jgi:membrane protein YdbS with pleckstrin-like domain